MNARKTQVGNDKQLFSGGASSTLLGEAVGGHGRSTVKVCKQKVTFGASSSRKVIKEESIAAVPYAKTVAHMKYLLTSKSAPMQKLLDLNKNRTILIEEIARY